MQNIELLTTARNKLNGVPHAYSQACGKRMHVPSDVLT